MLCTKILPHTIWKGRKANEEGTANDKVVRKGIF